MARKKAADAPKPAATGPKAFFHKNGQFSKTATFATVANVLVLTNYFCMSWLTGAEVDLSFIKFTVPAFDAASAGMILGLLNGTYLGNNMLKKQAGPKG